MAHIEDVQYLREHGEEESYVFVVDSKDRDMKAFPHANEYRVEFDAPFRNVCAFSVLDVTVPRTMYAVDAHTNRLVFMIENSVEGWQTAVIEDGDHNDGTLAKELSDKMRATVEGAPVSVQVSNVSVPGSLKSKYRFVCDRPFRMDMNASTCGPVIGFSTLAIQGDAAGTYTPGNYTVVDPDTGDVLERNDRVFCSVEGGETPVVAYEGPSDVNQPLAFSATRTRIAQRFMAPVSGRLSGITTAFIVRGTVSSPVSFYVVKHLGDAAIGGYVGLIVPKDYYSAGISGTVSLTVQGNVGLTGNEWYYAVFESEEHGMFASVGGAMGATDSDLLVYEQGEWAVPEGYEGADLVATVRMVKGVHTIVAPGMYNLLGEPGITIRAPEIESHMFTSLSFQKHSLGVARIKLGNAGMQNQRTEIVSIPQRKLRNPVGKLSGLTFRFERLSDGKLYDFKGLDNTLIVSVTYMIPKTVTRFDDQVLAPGYTPDVLQYIAHESDDEDEEWWRGRAESGEWPRNLFRP